MIEAGFLLLLFISYLVTLFMIMIASGQEPQFAIGILIIFGWAFAVPSIAYLLAADFVSKRFSYPISLFAYLLLVLIGCGL